MKTELISTYDPEGANGGSFYCIYLMMYSIE